MTSFKRANKKEELAAMKIEFDVCSKIKEKREITNKKINVES